jgi:hypothetical protein
MDRSRQRTVLSPDLAMSYTLSMSGVIVGRSDLEVRDAEARVVRGAFRPGLGYELAQPVFALYRGSGSNAEELARYRKARDALRLNLADPAGASVPVRDLYIRPSTDGESSESGLVLEIVTDDPRFWTRSS